MASNSICMTPDLRNIRAVEGPVMTQNMLCHCEFAKALSPHTHHDCNCGSCSCGCIGKDNHQGGRSRLGFGGYFRQGRGLSLALALVAAPSEWC